MNRREFMVAASASVASFALPTLNLVQTAKPKVQIVRLAADRFELISPNPESLRILQLTDTHFGRPDPEDVLTDIQSRKMIRRLVDEQQPDFIFHTGDFINNDVDYVEHSAIGYMNDLGTPWAVVFGNHDHSGGQPRGLSLNDYYARFQNHATGFHESQREGKMVREYCYRIDIKANGKKPVASLFAFNTGGQDIPMLVSPGQMEWFRDQLEADARAGKSHPILVMQHIPTIDYKNVFDEKTTIGRQGEKVCFELDRGAAFEAYRASRRVKGVFCGHDHVNDYIGNHQGVKLVYGRVSGWSGYGDWQRGGRIIKLNNSPEAFKSKVVLRKGATDKPEWSTTLAER